MISPAIICLFAKAPLSGVSNTRLIPAVGAQKAAELAHAFLVDSWQALARVDWARCVLSLDGSLPDDLAVADPDLWRQGEGDLGQRMERSLSRALDGGAPFAIAVGSDSPGRPPALLKAARDALVNHDAVLGPSEDGGYYLLGLRRCPLALLDDLPWSSERTLDATHERLLQRGFRVALLPSWYDVDRPEDLLRLQQQLQSGEIEAPCSAALLRGLSIAK